MPPVVLLAVILLAEMQLRPPRMPIRYRARFDQAARDNFHASLQDVSIQSVDNVTLRGWYVVPQNDNGSAVILLHGVGDNREGVAGYARLFLQHGYRVLLPDARAHGNSSGDLATYGLRESDDIHRWVDWLGASQPKCVYGFGESMGAALLLQSLAQEQRFCAVVVESPFARFQDVAYERAARYTRMPFWFGRTCERPVVDFAMYYTRRKYGLDFRTASPVDALAGNHVPILLIGDQKDLDIRPHHVTELHEANPDTELWMVDGAAHGGAWGANPERFNGVVTQFFGTHTAINMQHSSASK
jgi:pimeloyl-ACP methyl ester carboxylesterase